MSLFLVILFAILIILAFQGIIEAEANDDDTLR